MIGALLKPGRGGTCFTRQTCRRADKFGGGWDRGATGRKSSEVLEGFMAGIIERDLAGVYIPRWAAQSGSVHPVPANNQVVIRLTGDKNVLKAVYTGSRTPREHTRIVTSPLGAHHLFLAFVERPHEHGRRIVQGCAGAI